MITEDRQKQALYEWQSRLCEPIENETVPLETAQIASESLWKKRLPLPLDAPTIITEKRKEHVYDPWSHVVRMNARDSSVPVMYLIHEMTHAVIGAMGVGPVVASHGPLFCHEFGKLWSIYTTKNFSEWKRRCNHCGLFVAEKWPDLEEYEWAVVQENENCYAMRPARKAKTLSLNIEKVFTKIDHHPLAYET